MSQTAYGVERRPVEYAPSPASHLWIAVCIAIGSATLIACVLLGMGEIVYSIKRLVLEAIFSAK